MKKQFILLALFTFHFSFLALNSQAQMQTMTPELLWKLGRVSGECVSPDGKQVIYGITNYDLVKNKGERNLFHLTFQQFPIQ